MINVIERALEDASKAARQQSHQLLNELNSVSECMMAAKGIFEREMQEAKKLHEASELKSAQALRNFDAALIQMNAVIVTLKRQISDGEIVTGIMEGKGEAQDEDRMKAIANLADRALNGNLHLREGVSLAGKPVNDKNGAALHG